jgi:hypothetical protein
MLKHVEAAARRGAQVRAQAAQSGRRAGVLVAAARECTAAALRVILA